MFTDDGKFDRDAFYKANATPGFIGPTLADVILKLMHSVLNGQPCAYEVGQDIEMVLNAAKHLPAGSHRHAIIAATLEALQARMPEGKSEDDFTHVTREGAATFIAEALNPTDAFRHISKRKENLKALIQEVDEARASRRVG